MYPVINYSVFINYISSSFDFSAPFWTKAVEPQQWNGECWFRKVQKLNSFHCFEEASHFQVVAESCVKSIVTNLLGSQYVPQSDVDEISWASGIAKANFLVADLSVDFFFLITTYNFPFFFKVTNHEEVISQSLCKEDTKTKVVNYLSKVRNAWILPWLAFNRSQSSGRQQIMGIVFKRQWIQWKIRNLGYRGSSWRQQSLSNTTAGWRASKKIIQTKRLVRLMKIQRCVMFV